MINEKLYKIETGIDNIISDLLTPLRTSKEVNEKAFGMLYELLDELKFIIVDEEVLPKRLIGLLFTIYIAVMGECEHSSYTDKIFIESAKLEGYLIEVFKVK